MFTRSFNLQEMCLIAIVRDIDLFVYNKTIPRRHIDFLFRVYAAEVVSNLKVLKTSINEDCMLWLLNPHVKKVILPFEFHSEKVIEQLKSIGSGIISLNLRKSMATEDELNSIVCCIPNVVHLDLSITSCSDETLTCIQKSCPVLESLNVSYCGKITDIGMKNLCGNQLSLKYLNVLNSIVTCLDIILDRMPSLECVKCSNVLLYEFLYEFGDNQKQYNLTEHEFVHEFLGTVKVIQVLVQKCPKLKKLHFQYPVAEEVLKACTHFKNIEELKIKMSHVFYNVRHYDVLTSILPISKNLKTLILSCLEISALTLVECFTNLENLYLKNVSFTPFKKEDIKIAKTNLLTLVIKDIDIALDDAAYEGIALLISLSKAVTKLHLNHIKHLSSNIIDIILKSMKSLSLVNFNYSSVEMHFLNAFFEIPSITTIIADNFIREDIVSKNACTLSWRHMCNCDDKYYFEDVRDESDVISDQCFSISSESDSSNSPGAESDDSSQRLSRIFR